MVGTLWFLKRRNRHNAPPLYSISCAIAQIVATQVREMSPWAAISLARRPFQAGPLRAISAE